MKKLFFLLVPAFLLGLTSCEEGLTYDFEQSITTSIIADIIDNGLKTNAYPFDESETIDLTEIEGLEEYLDRLEDLEIKSAKAMLSGIPDGEEITSLTILVEQAGLSVTLNNLANNGDTLALDIPQAALDSASSLLLTQQAVEVRVMGESSYAPMELTVDVEFLTEVSASIF